MEQRLRSRVQPPRHLRKPLRVRARAALSSQTVAREVFQPQRLSLRAAIEQAQRGNRRIVGQCPVVMRARRITVVDPGSGQCTDYELDVTPAVAKLIVERHVHRRRVLG